MNQCAKRTGPWDREVLEKGALAFYMSVADGKNGVRVQTHSREDDLGAPKWVRSDLILRN
jgi:hypothetical protein